MNLPREACLWAFLACWLWATYRFNVYGQHRMATMFLTVFVLFVAWELASKLGLGDTMSQSFNHFHEMYPKEAWQQIEIMGLGWFFLLAHLIITWFMPQ